MLRRCLERRRRNWFRAIGGLRLAGRRPVRLFAVIRPCVIVIAGRSGEIAIAVTVAPAASSTAPATASAAGFTVAMPVALRFAALAMRLGKALLGRLRFIGEVAALLRHKALRRIVSELAEARRTLLMRRLLIAAFAAFTASAATSAPTPAPAATTIARSVCVLASAVAMHGLMVIGAVVRAFFASSSWASSIKRVSDRRDVARFGLAFLVLVFNDLRLVFLDHRRNRLGGLRQQDAGLLGVITCSPRSTM